MHWFDVVQTGSSERKSLHLYKYSKRTYVPLRSSSIFNWNELKHVPQTNTHETCFHVSDFLARPSRCTCKWSETIKDAALRTAMQHTSYNNQFCWNCNSMIHNEVHFDSSYGTAGCRVSSTRIFLSDACSNQLHFRESWNDIVRKQSTVIYKYCSRNNQVCYCKFQ